MAETLPHRIEAAEGADRALDAEIATAVRYFPNNVGFVWKSDLEPNVPEIGRVTCVTSLGTGGPHYAAPRYTASIDAALTLVPPDYHTEIRGLNAAWWAMVNPTADGTTGRYTSYAATPALALCAAALRAKESSDGE